MRIITHKLILFLVISIIINTNAQEKKHKEEFSVKPNVVIDINTRHSDIEIERWNKNKVVVEAYMVIEGEEITDEVYQDFYKKWDFDVTGNSEKIILKSRTNSVIDIHSFDFDEINYEEIKYPLANFSIGTLDVLDSIDFIIPPAPPAPPAPPGLSIFSKTSPFPKTPSKFDFDAYKKDENYLEFWKKENKELIGKNAKIKIRDNSISIKSEETNIVINEDEDKEAYIKKVRAEALKHRDELREYLQNKRREEKEIKREQLKAQREYLLEERKQQRLARKEALKERLNHNAIRRLEIKKVLKERNKLKVKRIIKIKVPKSAKLHMNVKYGELSFTN